METKCGCLPPTLTINEVASAVGGSLLPLLRRFNWLQKMYQRADVEACSATKGGVFFLFFHFLSNSFLFCPSVSLFKELNKFRLWADMTKTFAPNE